MDAFSWSYRSRNAAPVAQSLDVPTISVARTRKLYEGAFTVAHCRQVVAVTGVSPSCVNEIPPFVLRWSE